MATPSYNNPGYYEIKVWDPQTKGDVVTTFTADGKVAYKESVAEDGTRTLLGSVGGEVADGSGGDIATPQGPGYKRTNGFIVTNDKINPTVEQVAPGGQDVSWTDARDQVRTDLEKAKTWSENNGINPVKTLTGVDAPGFDNNKIDATIDKTLGGDGTGFGDTSKPAGSTATTTTSGGTMPAAGTAPSADPTQVNQDRQASRDTLAGLLTQYQNYKPTAAPSAGYATAPPVSTSAATSWAPLSTAAATAPVQGGKVSAAHVDPMTFGGPMAAGAGSSGSAQQAQTALADPATTYAGAQIDKTDSNEIRTRQLALADALTGAMNGQGSSVANQQLQMGLEQALQQQASMAASARGQNVGLGQYNAAIQGGQLAAQTNQQAALLRAQEIAQARGQLGDVLNTTRSGDINLAENQAGLLNTAGMFSAGEINKGNQFNAGQTNQVGMFNADQSNQNSRLDAQLGTQASIASMQSGNQYNAQMNALAQALAIQNGQWGQDTSLSNAQLGQQNNQFNATLGQQNNQFNAGQTNSYNQALAQALQQNNQFNAGQTNSYNQNQAGLNNQVNLANLQAGLTQQQINQTGQNNLLQGLLTNQGQLLGADTSIYGAQSGANTTLAAAAMNGDLQKYMQQAGFNQTNSYNIKDVVNGYIAWKGAGN